MSDPSSTGPPARGFLLHLFHNTVRGRTAFFGVGRLESRETFAFHVGAAMPAFYVRTSDREKLTSLESTPGLSTEHASLQTMDGEPAIGLRFSRLADLRRTADVLAGRDIRTYEADLNPEIRFLIDRGIGRTLQVQGPWTSDGRFGRLYRDPVLRTWDTDWEPDLRVLVLDIETSPEEEVLAVSLVWFDLTNESDRQEEIHLLETESLPDGVLPHSDEKGLLAALTERVAQIDPDILTGWNVVDFDLPVLERRMQKWKLPFNLGRTSYTSWIRAGKRWGGTQIGIHGRQVLDALHMMRSTPHRFEDYRLDTVSRALQGRGKTLEAEADGMQEAILAAYQTDPQRFVDYCLEDSRLVADLLEQEGLVRLYLRRSILTGLSIDRADGSIAAFDSLYTRELRRRGIVAPSLGVDRPLGVGAPGGLVLEPKPGLYSNVLVFDFKSLYPSLMRTFNIDPLAHISRPTGDAGEDGGWIEAPNGARFRREEGILPSILQRFWQSRDRARRENDDVGSYSYKILMNSFYGVLATNACRYADPMIAGAITRFGHLFLRWARDLLESNDHRVVYGDTDSLFVDPRLPEDTTAEAAWKEGERLCEWINDQLGRYVDTEYGLESRLELEFEKCYSRFFLPHIRGSEDRGRAKGYAGLLIRPEGESIEITGMEAVRRDWTEMAHSVQREVLDRVFHDVPAAEIESYVWDLVNAIKSGERDDELVYRKNLRKGVDQYTKSSPPHVKAARQLPSPSGVIHYVITTDGPQPLGYITSPIDYDHYVDKQLAPIVESIAKAARFDLQAALHGVPDLFRM